MIASQFGAGRRRAFGQEHGWISADGGTRGFLVPDNREEDISLPMSAMPAASIGTGVLLAVGAVFIYNMLKRK